MNHVSFVRIGIKSWSNSSSTYCFLVILQIYINLYPVDKFIRSLKHRGYLHIYISKDQKLGQKYYYHSFCEIKIDYVLLERLLLVFLFEWFRSK